MPTSSTTNPPWLHTDCVRTTSLIESFPRRKHDVFQRLPSFFESKSKVWVNKHWTSASRLFNNFHLLPFGYSAQECSATVFPFGQNTFRWRRKIQRSAFACRSLVLLLHLISLVAFGCSAAVASSSNTGINSVSSLPSNPLLKHRRESLDFREKMCHIWTKHTPRDLCARSRWSRLRLMREISLFYRDCDTEADNIQLGQFFRLNWQLLRSENDLVESSEHLKDGINGRSCILADTNSDECIRCFDRVGHGIQQVNSAYQAFDRVLHRFDCGLALDSTSATRPFSPNGTCSSCKRWYRKWLLVQLVQVWREPICINWCYYAQLACPHLATIRVVDFAGHPTFLCRDLDIPQQGAEHQRSIDGVASCSCIHPCDLSRISNSELDELNSASHKQQIAVTYDFFFAHEHCAQRQQRCDKERARMATLSDGFVDSSRLSSVSSHRGFVDEQSNEFYNRLISDTHLSSETTTSNPQSLNANELPFQQRKRRRRVHHEEANNSYARISGHILLPFLLWGFRLGV